MSTLNEIAESQAGKDNYNFVQLSRSYLKEMRALTRKSPLAQEILLYLVENMGRTSNAVVCSYSTLQEVTGVGRTSVAKAIKTLKDECWVEAVKVGNATAYAVNARVFWQAARNQKQYAIFQATVIASASEQSEDFKSKASTSLRHIPFVELKSERIVVNEDENLTPPDQKDLSLD